MLHVTILTNVTKCGNNFRINNTGIETKFLDDLYFVYKFFRGGNIMIFSVGYIVLMIIQYPFGSNVCEVLRVGIDFRIKCCGCGHMVMLPRTKFEKNVKKTIKQASETE